MAKIVIEQGLVNNPQELVKLCPFGAIEYINEYLSINSACKMCKLCVNKGPEGVFCWIEEGKVKAIDKSEWQGILVYAEQYGGEIHPVVFELLGKAHELAAVVGQKVYAVLAGAETKGLTDKLIQYGAEEVFVYEHSALKDFRIEPYSEMLSDCINRHRPSVVLVGGTTTGRALAPRVAARFRTGLTADCTVLEMGEDSDLAQIRPAFGGNIMAHIFTPNSRPQFATVRYKIFSAMQPDLSATGKVHHYKLADEQLLSAINIIDVRAKEKVRSIEDAEIIVVAGAACKTEEDLALVKQLADKLGGMMAATRPVIEKGMADPRLQIGLSGRTVKPKLIITCGVSGAIQFVAGMNSSECIVAINSDEKAAIFSVAHYGLVGDMFAIIKKMLEELAG